MADRRSAWSVAAGEFGPRSTRWASPAALSQALDPQFVRTPALAVIDAALLDVAEGRTKRLVISLPPQEGKTTAVAQGFPLWLLIRFPDTRVVIASYEAEIAARNGRKIRDDIAANDGTEGTLDLGLRVRGADRAAARWSLEGHAGGVYCVGVGGALTGRSADVLIIDDPVKDREAAESELQRERVWDWWQSTARTRLGPGAAVVLIMTRWHASDLAGQVVADGSEPWRVINIPAQADHDVAAGEKDPLGRAPGQWLVSARGRSPEEWESTRRSVGSRAFSALYQGHPTPESGDVWRREWWARYEVAPWIVAQGVYRMPRGWTLTQSWDMAFKDTKGSDFVVGQVWAQKDAEMLLLDQVRARLSFTASVAAVKAMSTKWPQTARKLVEDKANGTAVIDTLKRSVTGLIPVTPKDSKYSRATAVSPLIEAGNVQLPAARVALFDVEGFIEEAAAFPNGAHDDQCDAASQALSRMRLQSQSRTSMGSPGGRRRVAPRLAPVVQMPQLAPGVIGGGFPPLRSTERRFGA